MSATKTESLKITEIFHSIQGESTWSGLPCTFVRLTGCPLRCVWCDTEYAFHGGTRRTLDEIVAEVEALGYCGFAYTPDGLKSLAMFDTAKHCDARNYQDYYIFNFIFFPRKAA